MKQRHDTRERAADGLALPSPALAGGVRAGLVLLTAILAACAGPRAPAPISHRAPVPLPAPAVVSQAGADVSGTGRAVVPGQPVAGEQPAAGGVEAAPVVAGRLESRPLGGSVPPAPTAIDDVRQEPSGLKRPYSEEAYAKLAAVPMQGKRSSGDLALARPSTPAPAPAAVAPAPGGAMLDTGKFAWPVKGRLIQRFTDPASMGIAIEAAPGSAVQAAEAGRVIFSGPGPRSYGNLVIVKHAGELLSVYAHNSKILVKEGQNVTRGQKIAEVGATGTSSARLGFEVRRDGKPIDPLGFLAGG